MSVASILSQNVNRYSTTTPWTKSATGNDFDAAFAATQTSLDNNASAESVTATKPDETSTTDDKLILDTSAGKQSIDVDDYFTPKTGINFDDPDSLPPLLFPSADNIAALSSHASAKFSQFLADKGIPSAPSKITYDVNGHMQLPADYAYSDQLKQALTSDPAMERELRTVNALTSQFAAMQDSLRFTQEYEAAGSQIEAQAVVAKYNYLFSNNRPTPAIALQFSADGQLTVTADGKPSNAAVR